MLRFFFIAFLASSWAGAMPPQLQGPIFSAGIFKGTSESGSPCFMEIIKGEEWSTRISQDPAYRGISLIPERELFRHYEEQGFRGFVFGLPVVKEGQDGLMTPQILHSSKLRAHFLSSNNKSFVLSTVNSGSPLMTLRGPGTCGSHGFAPDLPVTSSVEYSPGVETFSFSIECGGSYFGQHTLWKAKFRKAGDVYQPTDLNYAVEIGADVTVEGAGTLQKFYRTDQLVPVINHTCKNLTPFKTPTP